MAGNTDILHHHGFSFQNKVNAALPILHRNRFHSIWIRADDVYIVGEIYTLWDLSVSFFAEKGFLSIDKRFRVHIISKGVVMGERNRVVLKKVGQFTSVN